MNQREIKFRMWDKKNKYWVYDVVLDQMGGFWLIRKNRELTHKADEEEYEMAFFTGLKDKNGKEIYEGDIVELAIDKAKMLVEYKEDSFKLDGHQILSEIANTSKVIGNVWENPELIK